MAWQSPSTQDGSMVGGNGNGGVANGGGQNQGGHGGNNGQPQGTEYTLQGMRGRQIAGRDANAGRCDEVSTDRVAPP